MGWDRRNLDRLRPTSAIFGPNSAKFSPSSSKFGRIWPNADAKAVWKWPPRADLDKDLSCLHGDPSLVLPGTLGLEMWKSVDALYASNPTIWTCRNSEEHGFDRYLNNASHAPIGRNMWSRKEHGRSSHNTCAERLTRRAGIRRAARQDGGGQKSWAPLAGRKSERRLP